jgi:putative intracellular protease/amidase
MSLKDPNLPISARRKRVAIVIANSAVSTTTQWPVGFWWSELTHPYYFLTEAGYEVEIFSPEGGRCKADAMSDPRDPSGYSANDLISLGFISSPKLAGLLANTRNAREIGLHDFDALIVAGGQAPIFTFGKATELQKKFAEFYEAGKIVCALCHGTALLRYTRLSNGEFLVNGKTVTGSQMSRRILRIMPCGA